MVLLKYFNAGTLSTVSNVLTCSRRSDRGDGAAYFPFVNGHCHFLRSMPPLVTPPPGGGGGIKEFLGGDVPLGRWNP